MQENNFEKQVQQKMEELQFTPSEPVWQKVALQIGKEKRKRRLILFLLPLLLLTGGAIWYATQSNNEHSQTISRNPIQDNKERTHQQTTTVKTTNQNPSSVTPEAPVSAQRKNEPVKGHATASQANKTNKKGIEIFLKEADKLNKGNEEGSATTLPTIKKERSIINEELHALVLQNEMEKRAAAIAQQKSADEKYVSKSFWDSAAKKEETTVSHLINDSLSNQTAANDAATDITAAQKDSIVEEAVVVPLPSTAKGAKNNKWEWTVTARVGASHLRSGMMDVFSTARADNMYASPSSGNNNPATGGSTGNTAAPLSLSGEISKSFAFSIGTGIRKRLLQNAFVVAGLQYSRYSTQAFVGTKVAIDTAVSYNGRTARINSYFKTSGSQSEYTTHYHYLELPIAFEYRLFKNVPLQLQHGISAGYLFSTNALYYDPAARILYKNNQWLRKAGLNVFTAVDYRLLKTPSFSLFLGPQAQWGIKPMQQQQEPRKHYLFFAGLQSRITF